MDEFTSMGMWFFIIVLSLNLGIIYLAQTDTFIDNGLSLKITNNTYFDSYNYNIEGTGAGNSISSENKTISGNWLTDMIDGATKLGNSVRLLLTAWTDLLSAILIDVPGAGFFSSIFLPIIGIIQIVAFFIIGVRVAGVIRGVV